MQEEISFGTWLRKQRRALDLSRQAFANQVGCAEVTLRRIEAGTLKPSKELASILLEKLDIPQTERPQWISFARGLSGFPLQSASLSKKPISNLPAPITTFIGREKEQAEVIQLTAKHRLVTLTGPGGVGKTRLSIKVGEQVLRIYPDGVWLVELAPILDPAFVMRTTAIAIGLRDEPQRPVIDMLSDYLREKQILIILDNCEQLLDACAQLADTLLKRCPGLKILATSREALGILGEAMYPVPSLALPDTQQMLEKFREYESVRLFEERAQLARMDFLLTIENASSVAKICTYLDGIPLAIELAAARAGTFSIEHIEERLQESFRFLTTGNRTALRRHQSLQAAIGWSYDLLSSEEKAVFRRLSVFINGWTLKAAEFICSGVDIASEDILDVLTHLTNKSLVIVEEMQVGARYRMLETIREYASEKLAESGEGEQTRARHLDYFLKLAERAEPELRGRDQVAWLVRIDGELDNIRVALDWSLDRDVEAGLHLAATLLWFWHIRGYLSEGGEWLERALATEVRERGNEPLQPARAMLRAKACYAAGCLMVWWGQMLEQGTKLLKESLALFQELGSAGRREMGYALRTLGWVAYLQADSDRAKSLLEESRVLFHELGDKFGIAECLVNLGELAFSQGDFSRARTLWEERLAVSKELGDKVGVAHSLGDLGRLAFSQRDYPLAAAIYKETIVIWQEIGDLAGVAIDLRRFAFIAHTQSQEQRVVRLLGADEAVRESVNSPIVAGPFADERAEYDSAITTARVALGEERFAEAWEDGKRMKLDEAIEYAVGES